MKTKDSELKGEKRNAVGEVLPLSDFITDYDVYLFKQGNHFHLYEKMGAHPMSVDGDRGTFFSVWAPNAAYVSVIGDFNGWNPRTHALRMRTDGSGIWEGFISGVGEGNLYKYHIISRYQEQTLHKGDPYAFFWEVSPKTASIVWNLDYRWNDAGWMEERGQRNGLSAPISIYEVHLGSWRRVPEEGHRPLTYRELAPRLAEYVNDLGFSHVEILPVMEHPFDGSWGYQVEGYFAPTSRYGTPQDFMYLVDHLHRQGIGVILDWVPSHFPTDWYGLVFFDGTCLYEHAHPARGYHPQWTSCIFNYGRYEVQAFLISSAFFWLERYHADALRVDGVSSMLYLDYGRESGEWIPNEYGGRENLEAIRFIRRLNEAVYGNFPHVQMIAEESTAYPMVTSPTYAGGLGFGLKWNMGWMHDTLEYFSKDPIFRKYHHHQLPFSISYAFSENFLLPLSHDEVVHMKSSLIGKMPGDPWQKAANLRLLLGYMFLHPGKKLLFMGGEFGQWGEWNYAASLDWHLLEHAPHQGIQRWVRDINYLYRHEPALHALDFDPRGFEWVDCSDWEKSTVSFLRKGHSSRDTFLVVCNFTPQVHHGYRIGVPEVGIWEEVLNSDAASYGGSGQGNLGGCTADPVPFHGRPHSLALTLPPLAIVVLRYKGE